LTLARAARALAALGLASGVACAPVAASTWPALCARTAPMSVAQQDRLLRFAALARRELEASGRPLALVARSGSDLSRFAIRYSHAGVSLKASDNTPWSVRQLYFACDEGRPRLYDQGLAGFLLSVDDPNRGYLSMVLLPESAGEALEARALDRALALRLLGADYSANAFAFSVRYQNCNQWLAELLASAWGDLDPSADDLRTQSQRWLAQQDYQPQTVDVGSRWLMFAAAFIGWLHSDDHPAEDVAALRFRISLPTSIESFVHARLPTAERIELCHDEHRVVIHRGWDPMAEGCEPAAGDEIVALD
jgi:hypothetical protein